MLADLTKGCVYTEQVFLQRYDEMFPKFESAYKIVVIEDQTDGKIVGAGTAFIEMKYLREAS